MNNCFHFLTTRTLCSRLSFHEYRRQPEQQEQAYRIGGCGKYDARGGGRVGTEPPQGEWYDGAEYAAENATAGHGEQDDDAELEGDGQVLGGSGCVHGDGRHQPDKKTVEQTEHRLLQDQRPFPARFQLAQGETAQSDGQSLSSGVGRLADQ